MEQSDRRRAPRIPRGFEQWNMDREGQASGARGKRETLKLNTEGSQGP